MFNKIMIGREIKYQKIHKSQINKMQNNYQKSKNYDIQNGWSHGQYHIIQNFKNI